MKEDDEDDEDDENDDKDDGTPGATFCFSPSFSRMFSPSLIDSDNNVNSVSLNLVIF